MIKPAEFIEDRESGAGSFIFYDSNPNEDKPVKIWFQKPTVFKENAKVFFVIPGTSRDGRLFRDFVNSNLTDFDFLLIAPEFSGELYPHVVYTLGNVFDDRGRQNPESLWTYSIIERLFDYIRDVFNLKTENYSIFGNSAGAQFVHRMLLFKKSLRLSKAMVANPAVYLMPAFSFPYPYGFADTAFTEQNLIKAFNRDFTLFLGENDNDETNAYIDRSPEAMRQGRHRLERGINFFKTAQSEAARLAAGFRWKLRIIPEADHDYPFVLSAIKHLQD